MKLTTIAEQSPKGVALKAALDDLKHFGIKSLDLDRVTAKSGIENIFPNMESLLEELAKLGFDELTFRIQKTTHFYDSFEERLFQTCKTYLTMAYEQPELIQLMFNPKEYIDTKLPEGLKKAGDSTFAAIETIMKDAIRMDQLKSSDSRNTTLATWSYIHGCALAMIRKGQNVKDHPEELDNTFTNLHGLLCKGLVSIRSN